MARGAVSLLAMASGHNNLPDETGRVAASRADVEKAVTNPAYRCIEKSDFPRVLNFEQQLKDIDDTINGGISASNSVTTQEALLGKEFNMQAMHVTTLKLEERMQASGSNAVAHAQPLTFRPQGTLHKLMHETKEISGLLGQALV